MRHTTNDYIRGRFEIYPVPGDGTCMFHAVGFLIGEDGHSLRAQVANYFMDHAYMFQKFITMSVEDYTRGIKNGDWGGELEIAMLARMKNIHVCVFDSRDGGSVREVNYNRKSPVRVNIIRTSENHYDALVPLAPYKDRRKRKGKARLGERCEWASDCAGAKNVCHKGRCVTGDVYEGKVKDEWGMGQLVRAFQALQNAPGYPT